MKLTEREKWIFVLTVMKTSETGKSMPMDMQQSVCEFLKQKISPSVTYDEWREMEYDIREIKAILMELMFKAGELAAGHSKTSPEARLFSEVELQKLDSKVKNTLQNIDFDELKKIMSRFTKEEQEKIKPLFDSIENLTGEYFREKK